jgi:hypothetical protein
MKKSHAALALLAALTACASLPARAALHKDSASGCAVAAPAYLGSGDYSFQYHGGCKAGLAEGQGKAVWALRSLPEKTVVWEGAFSAGVYLPPPAGIVSARQWGGARGGSGDTVVFDMGALPAQSGIPAARLMVEAASSLTDSPDPCAPRPLWVTNAPAAAITADSAAQALLAAASDKLKARCGARLTEAQKGSSARTHLQVRVVPTPGLEADRFGNPGPVLVSAAAPLTPGDALQSYSNQAAAQQRQQQQQTQDKDERQATVQRLRAFFQQHQARGGWAALDDIAQNPFRYAGRVVVTAARVDEVLTPTRAALMPSSDDDWFFPSAILDGEGIAQWKPGPRLLAVKVDGRINKGEPFAGWPQLRLVGSESCEQSRCADWLRLPSPLKDGEMP